MNLSTRGLRWLSTTDHKEIGLLYLWTSLGFFVVGGVLALLMRTQLARPNNSFLDASTYNQLVTMHGVVMVLFFLSPFALAFANYFVPLQIGARDLAFPRLNALSYWLYLLGGLVAISGFFVGGAADVGWTFYAPLTSREFSPQVGVDLAGAGLLLLSAGITVGTVNFLVTIFHHKRGRMSDLPIFTWSIFFTMIIMLFAFPSLVAALLMLVADRHAGTSFFVSSVDGATLWEHLFWFFGHPEVYILLLPGLGAVLEVVPAFSGRPLWGKKYIVYSLGVATALSFIVWVHHMFVTGIDRTMREFMTVTTELISVPFGVIYLCILATLWKGSIRFRPPMLFSILFLVLFLVGGITGVFLSSVALDSNFRGSYWVVAHFHFTLVGGAMMGLIAGLYFGYPWMTGRFLNERLSQAHFALSFVGFLLTFLPLFSIYDMPRRIVTYSSSSGWASANLLSTLGAFVFALAQLLFLINLLGSLRWGERAPQDPWGVGEKSAPDEAPPLSSGEGGFGPTSRGRSS